MKAYRVHYCWKQNGLLGGYCNSTFVFAPDPIMASAVAYNNLITEKNQNEKGELLIVETQFIPKSEWKKNLY